MRCNIKGRIVGRTLSLSFPWCKCTVNTPLVLVSTSSFHYFEASRREKSILYLGPAWLRRAAGTTIRVVRCSSSRLAWFFTMVAIIWTVLPARSCLRQKSCLQKQNKSSDTYQDPCRHWVALKAWETEQSMDRHTLKFHHNPSSLL